MGLKEEVHLKTCCWILKEAAKEVSLQIVALLAFLHGFSRYVQYTGRWVGKGYDIFGQKAYFEIFWCSLGAKQH